MPSTSRPMFRDCRPLALLLAASLITMANSAISPALPGLEARFGDHPQAALLTRLLVPAPSLAVVLIAAPCGYLVDRLGRWPLLLAGVALFAIAGCLGLILPSLEALLASRLLLGVAVALIMTSQMALVADYYQGAARSRILGLQISARNLGGLLAITTAGLLATRRPADAFAVHAVALLVLPVLWYALPEPRRASAPQRTTSQPRVIATTDVSATGWRLTVFATAALQMLTTICFFVMPTQIPYFLSQNGLGNTTIIGSVMGALTLAGALTALRYGALKSRIGHPRMFSLGFALMGSGLALLSRAPELPLIYLGAALVGIGFAAVTPNFTEIALHAAPSERRGRVSGILTTSVYLGQIASPLITLPLIRSLDYSGSFLAIACMLFLCAATALLRHGLHRARQQPL